MQPYSFAASSHRLPILALTCKTPRDSSQVIPILPESEVHTEEKHILTKTPSMCCFHVSNFSFD